MGRDISDIADEIPREDFVKTIRANLKPVSLPDDTVTAKNGKVLKMAKQRKQENSETLPKSAVTVSSEAFYDSDRKEFLIQNKAGRWLALNESQFKRWLRQQGIRAAKLPSELVSPAEKFLLEIMDDQDVRYAAPLAGRKTGFYDENGVRFLVTDSPRIIQSAPGKWNTLRAVIEGLFLNSELAHGKRQIATFYGWLKLSRSGLLTGNPQPGQALGMAGPRDCGKSLLQNLITEMLGGRSAKPHAFMTGRTDFNAELFEAEHQMLEDEFMGTGIKERLAFGAQIKAMSVNQTHSCHRKHRTAVNLRPFWRVTISLNDDPECLLVLPPLNADIADKIIVLRASRFKMPMPTTTADEAKLFWSTLIAELPAFFDYLESWKIPSDLECRRFGISGFQHPDLVQSLEELSPQQQLLSMIERAVWSVQDVWEGTAEELRDTLQSDSVTRNDAQKLLSYPQSCGWYLGRLKERYPLRFKQKRTAEKRSWKICKIDSKPDAEDQNQDQFEF
ncbi:MAG: hypothetical protein O3C21_10920 [Verrucomicrobia bacterium]|nr:hypothetical protein [Verrucomicrobiota bacterium]